MNDPAASARADVLAAQIAVDTAEAHHTHARALVREAKRLLRETPSYDAPGRHDAALMVWQARSQRRDARKLRTRRRRVLLAALGRASAYPIHTGWPSP